MSPQVFAMLELMGTQAENARKTCAKAMQGQLLPETAANHCLGISGYMEEMAHAIKLQLDKERGS